MNKLLILASALFIVACNSSSKQESNSTTPETDTQEETKPDTTAIRSEQKVFFGNLEDGQEITLPFVVQFGVEGMEVEPAVGVNPDKGHHHLLINQNYVPSNTMVPMGKESEGYYHFGKGQLNDTLTLEKYPMLTPGRHKLRLQFANGLHLSYGPAMSTSVEVVVK